MNPRIRSRHLSKLLNNSSSQPVCEAAERERKRELQFQYYDPHRQRERARYAEADRQMEPVGPHPKLAPYQPGLPVLQKHVEAGNMHMNSEYDDKILGGDVCLPAVQYEDM